MTDIDAVRAYRDAWLRSQSLHGYAVVDAADAAIAALEAELERLKVCGSCLHQDIDVDDDGSDYMPHPFVRYECDCYFPGDDYPEENDWPQGKDWGTAKNHDRCHFTPSRWTEATP